MDAREKIIEGDIVCVDFNGAQTNLYSKAVVLSIPKQTGDSWVFKDMNTGEIAYVSEGCTITKRRQDGR